MAKKRHVTEQELPFVALMDTMTNVVGVLTIVMVMIGISLARAANRVFSSLPPATAEQIQAAQAALDRLRANQAPDLEKQKALARPEITPAQLAALDTETARLERSMKDKGIKLFDLDTLKKELAKREAELKQKKESVNQLMVERERLKALLDNTPVFKAPPAKVVRIPASRPIPEGAKIEYIVVTQDGCHWIDIEGAKAAFLNEFKFSIGREAVIRRVPKGKQSIPIYDHDKLARYFEFRKPVFREFSINVGFEPWSSNPILRLVPKAPSGMGLQYVLQRVKSTPKTVVMFRVTPDGFENYLAAREICDKMGVPAGWEYINTPEYKFVAYDVETNNPKTPPKPAKPGDPVQIKPPSKKLD